MADAPKPTDVAAPRSGVLEQISPAKREAFITRLASALLSETLRELAAEQQPADVNPSDVRRGA